MRQAHSTSAARIAALPRLVTLPGTRLVPLLCSPGHRPVYELMARRLVKRSHEQISRVIITVGQFAHACGNIGGSGRFQLRAQSADLLLQCEQGRPVNFQTKTDPGGKQFT